MTWRIHFRYARKRSSTFANGASKSSQPILRKGHLTFQISTRMERRTYISPAKCITGLSLYIAFRLSSKSNAALWSLMTTIVCPSTDKLLIGPYSSLCFIQCTHSGVSAGGRSLMLPSRNVFFGPGGSGAGSLRKGEK